MYFYLNVRWLNDNLKPLHVAYAKLVWSVTGKLLLYILLHIIWYFIHYSLSKSPRLGFVNIKRGYYDHLKHINFVLSLYCLWLWCCKIIFCVFLCSFVLFYILCISVYYIRGDLEGCSFWSLLKKMAQINFI